MKTSTIALSLSAAATLLAGLACQRNSSIANELPPQPPGTNQTGRATFAGGCFWCMEAPFEKVAGVGAAVSGYTGGPGLNPTYNDYAEKGHVEVVQVTYDPTQVTYAQLLDIFWRQIDPTDAGGQFVDRGPEYRSAIFYHDAEQQQAAQQSKAALNQSGRYGKPVVTELLAATTFYKAEDYHQDFYKKSPVRYHAYRAGAGRDAFLQKIWGKDQPHPFQKPSAAVLKTKLTPLQYSVTQQDGTEQSFHNEFWDNHQPGLYVDIVSGEALFSSLDKFDSRTGWPSFTRPLVPGNIVEKTDGSLFGVRTEVRSKQADSHLGHVFDDGPKPTGRRYCINSAALRFIPTADLEKAGYGPYRKLFEK